MPLLYNTRDFYIGSSRFRKSIIAGTARPYQ